jgi:diguanylate cyclase (GGDEF)-like protein
VTAAWLDNLNVRAKLWLFMLAPMVLILLLISSGIFQKWQEYQNSIDTQRFAAVTSILDTLLHNLQRERGISGGYLSTGREEYQAEMEVLRQSTDMTIDLLMEKIQSARKEIDHPDVSKLLDNVQLHLDELPECRQMVDAGKSGEASKRYTALNDSILQVFNHLELVSQDYVTSRYANALALLLQLEEKAGQERGLLMNSFSSSEMSLQEFRSANSYVAQQEILHQYFDLSSSPRYHHMLHEKLEQSGEAQFERLRAAANQRAERNALLNQLQGHIGYGGLIHDFKNYVMRGDDVYRDRLLVDVENAQQVLLEYRELPGLTAFDLYHVTTIQNIIKLYQETIDVIEVMWRNGATVNEIDHKVMIDDAPALAAFDHLRSGYSDIDPWQWWSVATRRIDAMHDVSQAINEAIDQQIQGRLAASLQRLTIYIVALLVIIILAIYLGVTLQRRVAGVLGNMADDIERMHEKQRYDRKLSVTGDDELATLANAFNTLMSELNQRQQQLQEQARTDSLTGINNRRQFYRLGEPEIGRSHRYGRPLSLLILDVDHFKQVNDTYGHGIGDQLLIALASGLEQSLRSSDVPARFGGEEFVVLMPETSFDIAVEIAERLRVMATERTVVTPTGEKVSVTISIGVSSLQPEDTDLDQMIKRADRALYRAKEAGRNRVESQISVE